MQDAVGSNDSLVELVAWWQSMCVPSPRLDQRPRTKPCTLLCGSIGLSHRKACYVNDCGIINKNERSKALVAAGIAVVMLVEFPLEHMQPWGFYLSRRDSEWRLKLEEPPVIMAFFSRSTDPESFYFGKAKLELSAGTGVANVQLVDILSIFL